ncbi:MAG: NHLP leader peptide family RiPP precursor [Chamaesiphon sp.]|nr:NHLP leader peptide family RiPP precursor [Chamaesiphon sp.]
MKLDTAQKSQAIEALRKRSEFENGLAIKAYEDETFKQQLLADPKKIYAQELGTTIPDSFKIEVLEEKPNTIYLVLPKENEPAGADGELSDESLEAVAGGGWIFGRSSGNSWGFINF